MIGTTPTVAKIATIPLVESIRHAHPQLKVRFTSAFQRPSSGLAATRRPGPRGLLRPEAAEIAAHRSHPSGKPAGGLGRGREVSPGPPPAIHLPGGRGTRPAQPAPRITPDHGGLRPSGGRDAAGECRGGFTRGDESIWCGTGSVRPSCRWPRSTRWSKRASCARPPWSIPRRCERWSLAYPADRPVSRAARFVGDRFAQIAADLVEQKNLDRPDARSGRSAPPGVNGAESRPLPPQWVRITAAWYYLPTKLGFRFSKKARIPSS